MSKIINKTFPVLNMHCVGCASSIEKGVSKMNGVSDVSVNLANNTLTVFYDTAKVTPGELKATVMSLGFDLDISANSEQKDIEEETNQKFRKMKHRLIAIWACSIPVLLIGMFLNRFIPEAIYVQMFLAAAVLGYFGQPFFKGAIGQLRVGRSNMDTLVSLSTTISFLFSLFNTFCPEFWINRGLQPHSYYDATVIIIAFVMTGKYLEERAKCSTSESIRKLMGLQPKTARAIRGGVEVEIPLVQLLVGDEVSVRPGEQVPVDGDVIRGDSFVDESMVTGEPMAAHKTVGDKVIAGTINRGGNFVVKAVSVGKDTMLSHIIDMVQKAQGSKAPVQRMVDKVTNIFVPTVLTISLITLVIWLSIGGWDDLSYAVMSAISVLVIACPCALGLATPTALMVGIGRAAKSHILVKDAIAMEQMKKIDVAIMDKTGTLTVGHPKVTSWLWDKQNHDDYKPILLSMEQKSEHPLAQAIVDGLVEKGVKPVYVDAFESFVGEGVSAVYEGKSYWVGSHKMKDRFKASPTPHLNTILDEYVNSGASITYFGEGNYILAIILITDPIKPTSAEAIKELKRLGVEVVMLTGDGEISAKAVAKKLGVEQYISDAMPDDKERVVREYQKKGKHVAMVGDGINDSQALACANISVAMGRGTDIAMDVAMVTLMTSDLLLLPKAISLSKRTVRLIRQNLFWAFIYNIIGIPIAAGVLYPFYGVEGLLNPMLASAAMAFSSVSVVLNSLKLK